MKDKLFWIALIIAGVIIYNKMSSSSSTSSPSPEVQTERVQERESSTERSTTERSVDQPHFGDQNAPLKLPRKNGESQTTTSTNQTDYGTQTQRKTPDVQTQSREKEVSLGEYGTVTLPKKNGSSSTNQSTTTSQSNTSTNRNTADQTITLNPQTKRGEGRMTNVSNQPLLVLDGKSLQVSSLDRSEIYMDENSFCSVNGGSNNIIYVMTGAQLMLTGNGSNNTIYYEKGASVRNGINGTNNTLIELQNLSFK